jgi:hypothetical protein
MEKQEKEEKQVMHVLMGGNRQLGLDRLEGSLKAMRGSSEFSSE